MFPCPSWPMIFSKVLIKMQNKDFFYFQIIKKNDD